MHGFTNLTQIVQALRGRWKVACVVGTSVAVAIIAVAALLQPKYTATTWIVFNNRGSDAIVDKNDSLAFSAYVNGEVDLIASRRVLQHVAAHPQLLADPRTLAQRDRHQAGNAPLQEWLVDFIGRNVTVTSARGTRTVAIATQFDDPAWAVTVANGIANSYLATAVDLKVSPARQNVAFFKAQRRQRAAELARVQTQLANFLKSTGMTGLETSTDTDEVQLRALAERAVAMHAAAAGTAAASSAGGIDAAVSAGTVANPVVQQLRATIASQSAELRDLKVLSGPNFPAVVQAEARLAELNGQLATELGKVGQGLQRSNRVAGDESARLGVMEARQRRVLTETANNRLNLQVLLGDVARAKANYDAVSARLADVELQSALDAPSAAVLSPATLPRGASFPNWPLVVLMALAAGLVAGILAALVRELLLPRVRSRFDLETLLGGAPVLCDLTA